VKPGERVLLIKSIIPALLDQFDDAPLILTQFGVYIDDESWDDTPASRRRFLSEVVPRADDETLAGLRDFLIGGDQAPAQLGDDELWNGQPVHVFLSHKTEDAEWVSSVRVALASYGISGFVAHRDISPSEHWREVIKRGLKSCHVLVAVLHPNFHSNSWCDQEVGWAVGRGIPIVTVRRDVNFDRGRDGFLDEVQDIILDPKHGTGEYYLAQQIFRIAIRALPPELARRSIAEALVASSSFANTRALWPAIERQDKWEKESLDRLKYAVTTNRQVYEANVDGTLVPELIATVAEKYDPTPKPASYDDEMPF